jgi:hypothetical protein
MHKALESGKVKRGENSTSLLLTSSFLSEQAMRESEIVDSTLRRSWNIWPGLSMPALLQLTPSLPPSSSLPLFAANQCLFSGTKPLQLLVISIMGPCVSFQINWLTIILPLDDTKKKNISSSSNTIFGVHGFQDISYSFALSRQ